MAPRPPQPDSAATSLFSDADNASQPTTGLEADESTMTEDESCEMVASIPDPNPISVLSMENSPRNDPSQGYCRRHLGYTAKAAESAGEPKGQAGAPTATARAGRVGAGFVSAGPGEADEPASGDFSSLRDTEAGADRRIGPDKPASSLDDSLRNAIADLAARRAPVAIVGDYPAAAARGSGARSFKPPKGRVLPP
ncbi:hypothetical protein HPB48_019139 [Haemaphysalis longicornis]|uniref:Uncharacterized protein n=1 Tax=Haemaphysalis longicornis TaxID=44386 RepID=A0A9J6GAK2_HAELO|nr:hypothetical protein HPB48_019139 [Haemaphysalis longicornis]